MSRLVVGLGNPGLEYELTRHNIGWDVMDQLSFFDDLRFQNKFKGLYASHTINGEKVYFLKPQTYMNLSGESVVPLIQFFKVPIEEILVVHDELDLPFGTVMLKNGGGLAGHNGLKSIAAKLGTQSFRRLRMGIGRPQHGSVSSWVLSKYRDNDIPDLEVYLKGAAEVIELFLKSGFDRAANKYSKKNFLA